MERSLLGAAREIPGLDKAVHPSRCHPTGRLAFIHKLLCIEKPATTPDENYDSMILIGWMVGKPETIQATARTWRLASHKTDLVGARVSKGRRKGV